MIKLFSFCFYNKMKPKCAKTRAMKYCNFLPFEMQPKWYFFTKRTREEKCKLEILKWNKANNNCLNIWEGFGKFVLFGCWPNVTILCKWVHYLNKKEDRDAWLCPWNQEKGLNFFCCWSCWWKSWLLLSWD